MKDLDRMGLASTQLDRVLAFFPRIDSKISALLAVDIGMLALLALNLRAGDWRLWYIAALDVIAAVVIGWSLVLLYRASYPQLEGGPRSLIYFREIGARTEADYIKEATAAGADAYIEQLLAQVWRNSQILRAKFDCTKQAFIATGVALPFWLGGLLAASLHHSELVVK